MSTEISPDELVVIARIVDRSDCADFALLARGTTLRLRKAAPRIEAEAAAPAPRPPARPVVAEPAAGTGAPPHPTRSLVEGYQLRAPMLGTFYRAPAPGAPPFVEAGARVEPGTTLCIIEVMKVMNTVKADRSGIVAAIYAENAAMVEFGEVLMVIREEPAA